jgi:hypothetical protein
MEVEKAAGTSLVNDIAYQSYCLATVPKFKDSFGNIIIRAASQVLERLKDLMLWATPKRDFSHPACTKAVKSGMEAADGELLKAFNTYADACAKVSGSFSSKPQEEAPNPTKVAAAFALKQHRDGVNFAALPKTLRDALAPSAKNDADALKEILGLSAKTASARLDEAGWTATKLQALPDAEGAALTYLTKEVFVP